MLMYASWNARAVGLSLSANESIKVAARAGFTGVDLLVRDLAESNEDPLELRSRMDDLGLRGGAWPLPVDWRGNTARFREDLRQLPRYARTAAILGLSRTGTWVLPEIDPMLLTDEKLGDSVAGTVTLHVDRLGEIATILADHGSRLGLEIIGPVTSRSGSHSPFVHRYAHLADLMGEIRDRHPNVGVLVDAFHLFAAGEDPEAGFAWGDDRVVWVHVADPVSPDRARLLDRQRALPGETGLANCRGLLDQLARQGYDGPVTAEPLGACESLRGLDPLAAASRTMAALQSVWPDQVDDPADRRWNVPAG